MMTDLLKTERLRLRALCPSDAPRLQELCGNLKVARMLASIPHPYPDGLAEEWIAGRPAARESGSDYSFAIEYKADLIGVIGVERRASGNHVLGFWLGEPWWGQGLGSEAAMRIVRFAIEDLKLDELVAGHFIDNPASGRILEKCGFRETRRGPIKSLARDCESDAVFVALKPETS
jgi:RimJ/RimL family protein N-acetyltransferase